MFLKRMRINFVICLLGAFVGVLFLWHVAIGVGAIMMFFVLNFLIEWEMACERNDLDAYNRKIKKD